MRSAKTPRVPRTGGQSGVQPGCRARSIFSGSSPEILRPTGVRMPLVSMSMRPLMGMVQALLMPGTLRAAFISRTSSSFEMASGVMWRRMGLSHSGDPGRSTRCARGATALGLERDDGLEHGEGRGVGGGLGAAGLAEDGIDFRELLEDEVGAIAESVGPGRRRCRAEVDGM